MNLMKTRSKRKAFSLLEVVAAVVLMAIVATATVAGISQYREKAKKELDDKNVAELNSKIQAYYMETGSWPDYWMTNLYRQHYTSSRYNRTPYGGYYNFNWSTKKAYNRWAPRR